jgi:ComF family protein
MFESPPPAVNLRRPSRLTIRALARWFVRQLAPPVCVLCGAPGQGLEEPWGLDLCMECQASCQPYGQESLPFDACFCLFEYREPVDQLVTGLKFGRDLACARVLGTLFAQTWRQAGRRRPDCLIPLPLHPSRYRERGFCQTTEIARHLARRLPDGEGRALPVRTDLLRRIRATAPQSRLGAAARAANLAGAFATRPGVRPPPRVALLDDVLTTGSTAAAAAAALRSAGVAEVEIWCCARALRDNAGPLPPPPAPWPIPTPSPPPTPTAGGSTTS